MAGKPTVLPAYIIPITSAASGEVQEQESDVGKPDGAQSDGRLSSGSCVLCSGQTYGNDVSCLQNISRIRLQVNAANGIEWTQRKEGL